MDSSSSGGSGDRPIPDPAAERRRNIELRELLDELLALVRQLARRGAELSPDELTYAQQRLEWLSDEIWSVALEGSEEEEDDREESDAD